MENLLQDLENIKKIVKQYNITIENMSKKNNVISKKEVINNTKYSNLFIDINEEEDLIPDGFFNKYIKNDENIVMYIISEVRKYINTLGLSLKEGEIDIKDVINSNKCGEMTYIESLNRLYSETDSIDYQDRTIQKHLQDLSIYYEKFNNNICFWNTNYLKIADKYYINNFNGNHLNTLCKLIQISNKNESSLGLPQGFKNQLSHIKTRYYNTPDDLEFILLFNKINEMNLDLDFKLESDNEKGINLISINNLVFSNKYELLKIMESYLFKKEQLEEITNNHKK